MTKTFLTMAAVSALAIGSPALSQTGYAQTGYGQGGYADANVEARVDELQLQLQAGVRSGRITRAEARPLREQIRVLREAENEFDDGGFDFAERQALQVQIRDLRSQIRYAARNDMVRFGSATWIDNNRDGWDDRDRNRDGLIDARFASASGWIDRNQDGWDDRDRNRDGMIDSRYSGQGGPYEEVQCTPRSGIGGVVDTVLGRNTTCGQVVGQRPIGDLDRLAYPHNIQYRDGNGVYYRTDGAAIYQIDARTGVVTQVFDLN